MRFLAILSLLWLAALAGAHKSPRLRGTKKLLLMAENARDKTTTASGADKVVSIPTERKGKATKFQKKVVVSTVLCRW